MTVNGKSVTMNLPPCTKKRLLPLVGQQLLNTDWNWGKYVVGKPASRGRHYRA